MISIEKATEKDCNEIAKIGYLAVGEAHRASCPQEVMNEYLEKNYNPIAIQEELHNKKNYYHILQFNDKTIGFSNIILNAEHPNISEKNVTKLDRIYLLKEYYDLKLGYEFFKFNLELARQNAQSGMWLFTWVGNKRAINFYLKIGFTIIGSHNFKVNENHSNLNHQMFLAI